MASHFQQIEHSLSALTAYDVILTRSQVRSELPNLVEYFKWFTGYPPKLK